MTDFSSILPSSQSLKILLASAEAAPFAKVGGLADVVSSLAKTLTREGHQVIVAIPAYPLVIKDKNLSPMKILDRFSVKLNKQEVIPASLYSFENDEVTYWLIDGGGYFKDAISSTAIYSTSRDGYLFFSRALFETCRLTNWIPDIIHCNDWQQGFIPVLLKKGREEGFKQTATVFSIHNLAYQGVFGEDTLTKLDLPSTLFNSNQLETYGAVNFLKSGCIFADQVNTVSPTYAREIQTPEYGFRLEGLMSYLYKKGRFRGILNGIDPEIFNPDIDAELPANFHSGEREGKEHCKNALQSAFGLPQLPKTLLVGMVSRLSEQKGFDLFFGAIKELLKLPLQFVIQGLGDPAIARKLKTLQKSNSEQVRFINEFNPALAKKIYAASDLFLLPSIYEPCGLGQMISMRYGTLPVGRKTGGLADTIQDLVNGFIFESIEPFELIHAINRSLVIYQHPNFWNQMIETAMNEDYSWKKSVQAYLSLYEDALKTRRHFPSELNLKE